MLELLMNEELGVTDDVDEENVTNFEFDVRHLCAKARTFNRSAFSRMKPVASDWLYVDLTPSIDAMFGS